MVVGLLSFNQVSAQSTGVVEGKDPNGGIVLYNWVKIYDDDAVIGEAAFAYDKDYKCYNNIKYYNYLNAHGYIRLKVYVDGDIYLNKKVWVEANTFTYLDDAFYYCRAMNKTINVSIAPWKD